MDVITHPFRLTPAGRVATAPEESDDATRHLLTVLTLTLRGERALVPLFGIDDPAFSELDIADLSAGVEMFGPDVIVELVEAQNADDGTLELEVTYGD